MELARALPRYSRQTTTPTKVSATTHVDVALFNGFALPKVAAIIEVFQKANSLVASQQPDRARYDVSLLSARVDVSPAHRRYLSGPTMSSRTEVRTTRTCCSLPAGLKYSRHAATSA